jgi:excisionase family DNA binding protein
MTDLETLVEKIQALAAATVPVTYSIQDVAKILGCAEETLEAHFRSGRLPALKFGRQWTIPAQAFIKHINDLALTEASERRSDKNRPQPTAVLVGLPSDLKQRPSGRTRLLPVLPPLR